MYPAIPPYASRIVPDGFNVVCDETNNSKQDVKDRKINVSVTLKFKRVPIVRGGQS